MSDKTALELVTRYQHLIEISRDLASTLELDVLLARIVGAAADMCGAEAASIMLYDRAKGQLYFQASTNLDTPLMRGLIVPVDDSISGWILTNGKPLIVPDAKRDPRWFGRTEKQTGFQTESILGVPLIAKDQVIGVCQALNKINGGFTNDDQEILMTLGAQAAVAIENARLFMQSDLIAELVHELRTPLGSLNAATHLLLRPEVGEEKRNKMVMIIQSETKRLSELTTAFLDLARLESGRVQFRIEKVNLVFLLGECAGITRQNMLDKGIRFVWKVPDNVPPVTGDGDKLKQVFLNLLSNAIKYNVDGGRITLSADFDEEKITISVKDTGHGIPPESLEHMFKRFYRVPGTEKVAAGTGLGLSIVQRIVHAHGGDVRVESNVGEGAKFTVIIPRKIG